jgi:hypothetical protein
MSGDTAHATTIFVAADAQYGKIFCLFPFANFENVYQGQAGSVMIGFPGGLDEAAGTDGFDAHLHKGIPVPYGARLSIAFPIFVNGQGAVQLYRYFLVFRDRNLHDYRNPLFNLPRKPYHYARQGLGAIDGTLIVPAARYPIEARYHSTGYEQTEDTAAGLQRLNLYPEYIVPSMPLIVNTLAPDGVACAIQQGIYNPSIVLNGQMPMQAEFECDAMGDDLIIFCQKIPDGQGSYVAWNFNTVDGAFSNVYGHGGTVHNHDVYTDGGIRVSWGTNP